MTGTPGEPFRPANGSMGMIFQAHFCDRCEKDRAYREDDLGEAEGCQIIVDSMFYKATDPEYPKEWIYGEDGYATCTAFEPERDPNEPVRRPDHPGQTLLFQGEDK